MTSEQLKQHILALVSHVAVSHAAANQLTSQPEDERALQLAREMLEIAVNEALGVSPASDSQG